MRRFPGKGEPARKQAENDPKFSRIPPQIRQLFGCAPLFGCFQGKPTGLAFFGGVPKKNTHVASCCSMLFSRGACHFRNCQLAVRCCSHAPAAEPVDESNQHPLWRQGFGLVVWRTGGFQSPPIQTTHQEVPDNLLDQDFSFSFVFLFLFNKLVIAQGTNRMRMPFSY